LTEFGRLGAVAPCACIAARATTTGFLSIAACLATTAIATACRADFRLPAIAATAAPTILAAGRPASASSDASTRLELNFAFDFGNQLFR
jgi:hypothetical protein